MLFILCCVYDSKASAFTEPRMYENRATAQRAFLIALKTPGHSFAAFPGDYTLFEMGSFSPQDGKFSLHATPEPIGLGLTLLAQEAQIPNA